MIPERHVWLIASLLLLLPWLALYFQYPQLRRSMLWVSLFTAPFGLSEPLFVPEYWNPPSLFDLAQRTGFDIESLIFCFALGGVGAVLYPMLTRQVHEAIDPETRRLPLHRRHILAILSPFMTFPALYVLPWNPIYPAIVAMVVGAVATMLCRPDLRRNAWAGAGLFVVFYLYFLVSLVLMSPGYIDRVWNIAALSGLRPAGFPIEELLFAATFGLFWSGVYEHMTWHTLVRVVPRPAADENGFYGS